MKTSLKVGDVLAAAAAIFAVMFLISAVALKIAWGWIVPDLFPGAVEQVLIISKLSWSMAVKLALVLSLIGTFFRSSSS